MSARAAVLHETPVTLGLGAAVRCLKAASYFADEAGKAEDPMDALARLTFALSSLHRARLALLEADAGTARP